MKADEFLAYIGNDGRIKSISDLSDYDEDKSYNYPARVISFATLNREQFQKLLDFIEHKEEELQEISREKDYWLEAYKEKEKKNCELAIMLNNFIEEVQWKLKEY
jgi:hypothetical protein